VAKSYPAIFLQNGVKKAQKMAPSTFPEGNYPERNNPDLFIDSLERP
jgi:hypothetical protein